MGSGTKVIGYVRVSTAEQADSGAGLETQRAAIRLEATRRGWVLVDIVEDHGYSAKTLKRPGIAEVLWRIERSEASAVVVAKLDRLSRSMLDFAGLTERAIRKVGV